MKRILASALFLSLNFALSVSVEAKTQSDLEQINKARQLYVDKKYTEATQAYSQIAKSSDFWLTAIEERAHTYGKMGAYDKSLADLTTLFTPMFAQTVGPETFFTAALDYLRLCQYSKVISTLNDFKNTMRPRIAALSILVDGQGDAVVMSAIDGLLKNGYTSLSYAKQAGQLPINFHQDKRIHALFIIAQKKPDVLRLVPGRVAILAQQDLDDIESNLNKLQLVEAEVMQRIHLVEKVKDIERSQGGRFAKEKNQISFPYNKEVWLDELDSYQVKTRNCPKEPGQGA